jgi:glycosyltransferase involved in cell wall biosynthesis/GT2 family glycosyltransferase
MSGADTPKLTLVTVAWNSGELLPASVEAFRRSGEAAAAPTEVVVVDNASTDGSAGVARAAGADRVVENPLNVGFVVAASQGLALATSDWVLLANPDLVVSEAFVGVVLEAAATAPPDVAVLVPDIRYASDPRVINSRGLEVDDVGVPAERDAGRAADTVDPPSEVFGASSSASILRVEALRRVGGLEPAYFAYLEDVDVAWRLRKSGYRALLLPDALALHEGSASTGEGSWLKAFLVARNRRILFRLHGPRTARARAFRLVIEVGHASVQALSGSRGASIRGRFAATHARRYARFLRQSNVALDVPNDRSIALAPRFRLLETLQRKQTASLLMRHGPSTQLAPPARVSGRPEAANGGARAVRVLIDAANLKPGQGGIRTYTMGLIRELARDPRLSVIVASSLPEAAELGSLDLVRLPEFTRAAAGRAVWRETNLSTLARTVRADVMLAPVPELPARRLEKPSVVVVHDVGPFVAPAFYSRNKRLRYETVLRHACRRASSIVCVSEATLIGLYAAIAVDPRRCCVIGEGPQLLDDPAGTSGEPVAVDGPFFLYVGSLDPRKNVDTLVDAFAHADPPLPRLVIAGPASARERSALDRRIAGAPARVQHLGFVDPAQLRMLYASCVGVVLPSLYEGFGLPVLEAFEAGAPVIASDIPTVNELSRDGVLRVDSPLDPGCWRSALRRLAGDPDLASSMRDRGRTEAERYSWHEIGTRFADLLVATAHVDAGAHASGAAVRDAVARGSAASRADD